MFDDVYGYDLDGDGFIDTPDRGSIFGYDFDGDGDIDWRDDAIGMALYLEELEAEKQANSVRQSPPLFGGYTPRPRRRGYGSPRPRARTAPKKPLSYRAKTMRMAVIAFFCSFLVGGALLYLLIVLMGGIGGGF